MQKTQSGTSRNVEHTVRKEKMRETTIEKIEKNKVIVILRGYTYEECMQAAALFGQSGIRLIEVPYGFFPVEETERIISGLKKDHPELCIGAGTVLSREYLQSAIRAGAEYIISPNVEPDIIRQTVESGLVSIPGALTPTEICLAHEAGADFVKVFPVNTMPKRYIKDVRAPLSHIRLIAVGGVDEENFTDYLDMGASAVGVGSSILTKEILRNTPEQVVVNGNAFTRKIADL